MRSSGCLAGIVALPVTRRKPRFPATAQTKRSTSGPPALGLVIATENNRPEATVVSYTPAHDYVGTDRFVVDYWPNFIETVDIEVMPPAKPWPPGAEIRVHHLKVRRAV